LGKKEVMAEVEIGRLLSEDWNGVEVGRGRKKVNV
jgi:hypothetical protein